MAVNVNTVYQTVLYILNKEQRGYAPPDEFNSIGAQVQLEIFNSYFPDGNQINRLNQNNSQNSTEFFNIFDNLSYKLTPFIQEVNFILDSNNISFTYPDVDPITQSLNSSIYLIGEVICTYVGNPTQNSQAQKTTKKEYTLLHNSKLTRPTAKNPIYYNYNNSLNTSIEVPGYSIIASPTPDSMTVNTIKYPTPPIWGFTGGSQGQYIYNQSSSTNFSLDSSEQTNIVIGILKYLGVVINDPTIIQAAAQEAAKVEANEKS
jgi:hypothetical protein